MTTGNLTRRIIRCEDTHCMHYRENNVCEAEYPEIGLRLFDGHWYRVCLTSGMY